MWLNILAVRKVSVATLVKDHWMNFGRDYYSRHDYEGIASDAAADLMDTLKTNLSALPGQSAHGMTVIAAEDFSYTDPIDGSVSSGQGVILTFEGGARAMLRLSGTGTEGATLRVYLEQYAPPGTSHDLDAQAALSNVIKTTSALAQIEHFTKRHAPDVVT